MLADFQPDLLKLDVTLVRALKVAARARPSFEQSCRRALTWCVPWSPPAVQKGDCP
jgi:hypothetical protein